MTEEKPAVPAVAEKSQSPLSLDIEKARVEAVVEQEVDPAFPAAARQLARTLATIRPEDGKGQAEAQVAVDHMGASLQSEAARRSAMLKAPIRAIAQAGEDGGPVAKSLVDLKLHVEKLDPATFDFSPGWLSRTLGFLPFMGDPIKRYFTQFESAQTVIDVIIESLKKGRDQLRRDNVTLEEDRSSMRGLSHKLARQIRFGELLDTELSGILSREISPDDPRRSFLEQEVLFPLRQRIIDLQAQLAVNQQGALAISVLTQNNRELVRGVDRALDVTVSALQVAVTVALGLAHQKIVLDKISALKGTTEGLIAGTAERLKVQGAEIHKRAAEPAIQVETLKRAFADIRVAIDDIARYRSEALPKMAQTILDFDRLAGEAAETLRKVERGEKVRDGLSLDIT